MKTATSFALLALTIGFSSCSDDKEETLIKPSLEATTVSNLAAGVTTTNGGGGQPTSATKYTFYSLANNAQVATADSNTTKWDVGFKGTTLIINGGNSGPGQGGALVQTGLFTDIASAPETGYAVDAAAGKAIPTGSGNGWYNYDGATNIVTPIAGKVILVRTATGKYAKLEIVSYYQNAPATPTATSVSRYYTFRYLYQPDGSRNLK
ncbi:HmuY family protein [Hymenobacter negativus]|uniref:HmuY family protein n=1 Tax=Hymenobacter negativus TaxID=2795026 RepID=A0ABS3QH37_9BACT|nr:HmuY family protein [Hymenobacter negativus]MBO2010298.1 HmuY family protein [Hymenobacter negativus]